MREFSNLASLVLTRTYKRPTENGLESFQDVVDRVILGNVRNHNVSEDEVKRLKYFLTERKAGPGGRGWWFSGTDAQKKLGGLGLVNCWTMAADDWMNFVIAQSYLMVGGGCGLTVESKYSDKLPKVKKDVVISHKLTKDADYIVPDSREGWCKLLQRVLEAFFITGKGFTYSTICVRGPGEPIKGFGGISSGPRPLVRMIEKISAILISRQGRKLRPIDCADLICCIGEMVVSGNVRRSAILILGDAHDQEFLKAKRWDLGPIPTQRAMANFSVNCSDAEHDLRPLFWKTYKAGEAFGIVNIKNLNKYGRLVDGPKDDDFSVCVNPCGEMSGESSKIGQGGGGEPCNLQDINLAAINDVNEFIEASVLMHRWGKRVTCEDYRYPQTNEIIGRNRRVGTGITGCLMRPDLFNPEVLDIAYRAIQQENIDYAKELNIPPSIRTTVIKPSGTLSKMWDVPCEGIHPAFSRYFIQRIRVASSDALIPKLREAGHYMEPQLRLDGTPDPDTMVVDFYVKTPDGVPTADEGFDTWKQLEAVQMAQKYWADQSISTTVYYKDEDLPRIQEWLKNNLDTIKTVSFLKYTDSGWKQMPKERITQEQYERLSAKVKPVGIDEIKEEGDMIEGGECAGGACPIR